MFWTESGTILETKDRSVIVTTLVGILIQIVKVTNGVVILLNLQKVAIPKVAIPKVAMSQRKVTTSLLQETILIHGGEEGNHIKISLLYSGLLPTWKDHVHFLSLATVDYRYAQLDLGQLITFPCLSIRISHIIL